ncbi:hypothetical protein TNCV_1420951 [Trichonephila clavipes]|nr:hypothetical protein TNCV_1420951 [Trichonephila clavipes]
MNSPDYDDLIGMFNLPTPDSPLPPTPVASPSHELSKDESIMYDTLPPGISTVQCYFGRFDFRIGIKKTLVDNFKGAVMEARYVNEFRPNDVLWGKTSKGLLKNPYRMLKTTDKMMVYVYGSTFFVKKDFTFGFRTVKLGEPDFQQPCPPQPVSIPEPLHETPDPPVYRFIFHSHMYEIHLLTPWSQPLQMMLRSTSRLSRKKKLSLQGALDLLQNLPFESRDA